MILPLLLSMLMHPFHVSLAEGEWNPQSERFEIAIRLEPRDFQLALSKHAGKRIDLETTDRDQLQAAIMAYVKAKFVAVDGQDRPAQWHWVGMENETKYVWVYLELQPNAASRELRISHRMLHEVAPTQVNTLLLVGADEKQTLRFTKAQPTQTLRRDGAKAPWELVVPKT
ncbi:DUF6702 family protein [Rosistilla oblonga]|uniref:DUF6702 family protein n=1 Tax=Rosistilla oblonga TaxID=2527990 RepID=UPI003A9806C2